MEVKNPPTIKINFRKTPDHKTYPVSGVWGGATPQGDIVCNFYIEHLEVPNTMELEINVATGKAIEKIPDGERAYTREILTSVVLRPDIAISIGKWLISKAEDIRKSRQPNATGAKHTLQ